MTSEWREVAVEAVKARSENALATGPFGSSIASRFFTDTGVPVIRGSNLSENVGIRLNEEGLVFLSVEKAQEFNRSIVREGDLVFTCWGTINQVGLIDRRATYREYVISNKQMKLTPEPLKADSLFLYYLFSSPELQNRIRTQSIGSSVPGFNLGQLRTMRISLPEVEEQRAISHLLGTLDDKIELNRQVAEALEATARALFHSWFVDFNPVRAKAEGRPIDLPDDLTALFPDRFGDDGLPERWLKKPVGILLANVIERVRASPETASKPYVPIDAILPKSLCGVEPRAGRDAQSSLVSFEQDDILFGAMRPYFHKVCIAPSAGTTRTTVFVLRPRDISDLAYCLLLMSEESTIEFATNGASGSTIPYATWEGCLESMPITIPPPRLRIKFGEATLPTLRRSQTAVEQSRTLATLRDTLLPKLISGELRIADAEKRISAA
jgi:type I restriction enzyme, S subunit